MKYKLLSIFLFFMVTSFSQMRISDVYVGFGYQNSKLKELNNSIYSYDFYISDQFYKIKGFKNIIAGFETEFSKPSKFSFDFSLSFLFSNKQLRDFSTIKEFTGFLLDTNGLTMPPLETVNYDFGFQMSTFLIEFIPQYKLISKENYYLNIGFGPNIYITSLKQKGVNFKSSIYKIQTQQVTRNYTDKVFSWQGNVEFGLKIFENVFLELMIKYRSGRIYNIGSDNSPLFDGIYEGENELYPVSKADIDFSGFNFMINLKYRFKTHTANN